MEDDLEVQAAHPRPQPVAETDDEQHLRVLAICYFVSAGLTTLSGLFVLPFVLVGGFVATAPQPQPPSNAPAAIGYLFGGLFACAGVCILLWAFAQFLAGRYLLARKGTTLIQVVAALTCLSVPLGTALGIVTFIVLSRPSVRAMFGAQGN